MPVLLNALAQMMIVYSLTADAVKHNTHARRKLGGIVLQVAGLRSSL